MSSVNKAIIIGNLGRDPETRYSADGAPVATASIATTFTWKSKDGEKHEETEWHRVVFFGKIADVVGKYLKKGSQVYVEGRLQTSKWQAKDGTDRYTTQIVAESMKMLGGRRDGDAPATSSGERAQTIAPAAVAAPKNSGRFDDMRDDIPF